jgi:hypothetical protein
VGEPGTRQETHLETPISRVAPTVDVAHEEDEWIGREESLELRVEFEAHTKIGLGIIQG